MSTEQISCETCLKLQKKYSAALRKYADVLERRTQAVAQGNYTPDAESIGAINGADWACSEARAVLERHESQAHPKTRSVSK